MALWTPYAEDSALDLTKTAVKEERENNISPHSPELSYVYSHSCQPVYAAYTNYPYSGLSMPSVQMSPISGGSTCSGYDAQPISPVYAPRSTTLSPPDSPPSAVPTTASCLDVDALSDDPDFQAFEKNALRAMAEKNGGTLLGNNPRMRRAVRSTNQDAANDAYRKQRERNNFAAKQSRDRRKLREIHLALKVSYLKNEVANLKAKLASKVCSRCQQMCVC
ncbi:unnamed protein product [Chilo suppressalis]|uniref:BZIP domain-containing protein n=1 Tax=Chilo suppressalis TaxID=168631 RepID=A0ABN8B0W6_CHISP|nr:unnamed protein product [Chilo suppressalis]